MKINDVMLKDEEITKIFDLAYYQNQAFCAGMSDENCEPESLVERGAQAQILKLFEIAGREQKVVIFAPKGWEGFDLNLIPTPYKPYDPSEDEGYRVERNVYHTAQAALIEDLEKQVIRVEVER